jgi:hypothetical protein
LGGGKLLGEEKRKDLTQRAQRKNTECTEKRKKA